MPNWYAEGKKAVMSGQVNLLTADVRAVPVTAAYTENLLTHDMLDDLGANTVGTGVALTNKSITCVNTGTTDDAVFDADDTPFPALAGSAFTKMAIYVHTGVASTSRLLAIQNTTPTTPNGQTFTQIWDNGASKVMKL
jgi:hypothetical protein